MRPSRATIAACGFALLVALLYVSPLLRDLARTGLDWPIWIDHAEGFANTSYGKWWVLPPHRPLVDGHSGEFPTYYQNLSDALYIQLAEWTGWPAMTVQAVFYGPLLGAAFLLLNYFSLGVLFRDRRLALLAALILSFGANSSFRNWPEPVSGQPLDAILHVPFHAISLATAQSLGWVLVLPCLVQVHLAYRQGGARRGIAAGALSAALFYAHSLTFVNVAFAQVLYLVLSNAVERRRDRAYVVWLAALLAVAGGFVYLVATRSLLSFASLVALGCVLFASTFLVDTKKTFYLWTYGTAGLLALPYVLVLARHARAVVEVQDAWGRVQTTAVGLRGTLLFFAAYLVAALVGYLRLRDRALRVWVLALLLATAFLGVNHLWHWHNHSYRFVIHLLFPLGVLAAVAVRHAPRPVSLLLGGWLAAVAVVQVAAFVRGDRPWVAFRVAEPARAAFLASVRRETAPREGSAARILIPAGLQYTRGLGQAAMLMNYSRVRSFVPDYRFVLWRERYYNRMGLYCFVFPGYPNDDFPFGRRACDEPLEPEADLVEILDPRLRTALLPAYAIEFAGAPAKPFATSIKQARERYGWPTVVETANSALVRTRTTLPVGAASVVEAETRGDSLAIRFEVGVPGPQWLVLGGRRLASRAPVVRMDGRELAAGARSANWGVWSVPLERGPHVLELPSLEKSQPPEAEYLYAFVVVAQSHARTLLRLGERGAASLGSAPVRSQK